MVQIREGYLELSLSSLGDYVIVVIICDVSELIVQGSTISIAETLERDVKRSWRSYADNGKSIGKHQFTLNDVGIVQELNELVSVGRLRIVIFIGDIDHHKLKSFLRFA